MSRKPLFVYDPHRDGNQRCAVCGKRFRRKSSSHGLAHLRRGEAEAAYTQGATAYEFTVRRVTP